MVDVSPNGMGEPWRECLKVEPASPMGELREAPFPLGTVGVSREEVAKKVAAEASRLLREEYERSKEAASKRDDEPRVLRLAELRRRRETLVDYARDELEAGDWHGLSDAANDLRELDVEIRMTEGSLAARSASGV